MVQTAANVVERVLPPHVPLRRFVVTFPYEWRGRLGFDSKLLSKVSGVVVDSILSFYERRMRALLGPLAIVTLSQLSQQGTNTAGEGEATLGATVDAARATHRPRTRRRKRWPTS